MVACSQLHFYAAWNPPFVVLLWLSTVVDWFVGKAMAKAEDKKRKRRLLFVSLGVNLGLLAYFKYAGFFCCERRKHCSGLVVLRWNGASLTSFYRWEYHFIPFKPCHTPSIFIVVTEHLGSPPLIFALFVTFFLNSLRVQSFVPVTFDLNVRSSENQIENKWVGGYRCLRLDYSRKSYWQISLWLRVSTRCIFTKVGSLCR